ncbi:uncharacterized protein LOC144128162 [Amblyomma americanum]
MAVEARSVCWEAFLAFPSVVFRGVRPRAMDPRTFEKKYRTKHAYGKRKRKPVTARKKRLLSAGGSAEPSDRSESAEYAPNVLCDLSPNVLRDLPPSRAPASDSETNHDLLPSKRGRSVTAPVTIDVRERPTIRECPVATSSSTDNGVGLQRSSPPDCRASETRFRGESFHAEMSPQPTTASEGSPMPSTSSGASTVLQRGRTLDAADAPAAVLAAHRSVDSSPRERRTIQAHLKTRFVSVESAELQASRVRESLRAVSATERKFGLTGSQENAIPAPPEEEFMLVQVAALNSLIGSTLCPTCQQPGLAVHRETELGLAVKMVLSCISCGTLQSEWSSQRKSGSRAFEVNIRAMQAIKSIGKGPTALNDFSATMNVSHRGLHHKTYDEHLKKTFKPAAAAAAHNIFTDAVEAVKKVYIEMGTFSKNITVVYDGTWLTRGHSSHTGVGCIIEFHTGLVLDCVVLSNFCLGCSRQPAESDPHYAEWKQQHQCQKNTDVNSGRMEVEAALQLFRRSLSKNDLRYTNIVCDGDSRMFRTLCDEEVYGFVQLSKEDCINHVKKRIGAALRSLVAKAKKGEPLGGKGGLTQQLIKKLTNYYGLALRNHSEVEEMQRAVMATYYHITSTDGEPHHELCPPGPLSWCNHRSAEAEGQPAPAHKYKLSAKVAEALLPVYQRLSDPQLLARCKGGKTQNAAESLHSVIWSLISKDQHASLFAVETAVHEAISRYNSGSLKAYSDLCTTLGLRPGALSLQRAVEKDSQRMKKAHKVHLLKGQRAKKSPAAKDTKFYNAGAF